MKNLTGEVLVNLVEAEIFGSEGITHLQKMYDWLISYEMERVKFIIGTGLTLLVGLFFAFLKNDIKNFESLAELALISSIIVVVVGFIHFRRVKKIRDDYPQSMYALKKLYPHIKAQPTLFRA